MSRSIASGACARLKPNFEPAWPVRIAACVSATTPGVTRIITSTGACERARACRARRSCRRRSARRASAAACSSARGLRVAVEDDPVAVEAGLLGQRELAAGRDVDAQALLVEDPQDRRAGEGLGGEDDLAVAHRGGELARAGAQVVLGDGVQRRAELAREFARVAAADGQAAAIDLRGLADRARPGRLGGAGRGCCDGAAAEARARRRPASIERDRRPSCGWVSPSDRVGLRRRNSTRKRSRPAADQVDRDQRARAPAVAPAPQQQREARP